MVRRSKALTYQLIALALEHNALAVARAARNLEPQARLAIDDLFALALFAAVRQYRTTAARTHPFRGTFYLLRHSRSM